MSWTLTTSGAALAKAGLNNAMFGNAGSASLMSKWSDDAEGYINLASRYDWVTNYSSVGTNFKPALSDCTAAHIAMNIINYDMSGYTSRTEAQTMLDVLNDQLVKTIALLKDEEYREVLV